MGAAGLGGGTGDRWPDHLGVHGARHRRPRRRLAWRGTHRHAWCDLPGAGDGRLFAVSAADGAQLWEFNTAQEFDTVNRVPARGGAIATSGAVAVDGMVFVTSGYAINAGAQAGNVLLAFGVE